MAEIVIFILASLALLVFPELWLIVALAVIAKLFWSRL